MSDINSWLQSLGLEKYGEEFVRHDIDLSVAPDLTDQDLEKLGLSLGHRRKFMAAAAKLQGISFPSVDLTPSSKGSGPAALQMERRQVTVLFADLVGSTELAGRMDPEDMSRLLLKYRDACTAVIRSYDGFVAQYLGDGVLAYFGFPLAQELAVERAVRAGLELVAKVGMLNSSDEEPLHSRVGIATGLVVAGEVGGAGAEGEQTVVGDTPNLAARLQVLAEPDSVLVSSSTHQLTGHFFEYVFLGEHTVKGFREPVSVWRVLGASAIESRFAAARAAAAGPIVGRDRELAFLSDSWQRAAQGDGHVVLVSGEAGMGKSRLVEAFAERIREEPHRLLRCQCSPYHSNSALYPLRQLLRHRLDIKRDLSSAENLQRIDWMLAGIGRASRTARLLLAELLEVPVEDALSSGEMTPAQRKNEMLKIVEEFVLATLDGAPVLFLIEDAHWCDATTQALLERLLKRIDRARALIVVTHRPDLRTTWAEHPQATLLYCKQLGRENGIALARHVTSQTQIEDSLIEEIVTRSDGVPLYIEELTKAVLNLRSVRSNTVPLTLKDSLMARLDRLAGAKDIAQTASVIGRQFPHDLLAVIAGTEDGALRTALAQLREAGLIFAAGEDEESVYSFNHALVQETAYESLSLSRRQTLHAAIARELESGRLSEGESEPAVIAHHYSRAGEAERSYQLWLRTAERSSQRMAFAESLAALDFALAEAEKVADSALRLRLKAGAQLKIGVTIVFQKGPQSAEAEVALREAHNLAGQAKSGPQLFQATWGLFLNAARNRRLDKGKILSEELLNISEALGDEDLKFEALHHRWGFAYFMGETADVLAHTARGLQLYVPARHHRFSYDYAGHDPGVCANCVRALLLGIAGDTAKVKPVLEAGLALSESLQHPMSMAFGEGVACHALYLARDLDATESIARRLVHDATKYDLPAFRAVGAFWLGATQALGGDPAGGAARMEPELGPTNAIGFYGAIPGAVMADALVRAGRERDALALISRLFGEMSNPESGLFVSELWRIRGEIIGHDPGGDAEDAERNLQTALLVARGQQATLLQSRAGISLSRLLAERDRSGEARNALAASAVDLLPDRDAPEVAMAASLSAALG